MVWLYTCFGEVAAAEMPAVEIPGIAGQQAAHQFRQRPCAAQNHQVKMVRHKAPGQAFSPCSFQRRLKPLYKISAVGVVGKDLAALVSAADYVIKTAWNIQSCGSWHIPP